MVFCRSVRTVMCSVLVRAYSHVTLGGRPFGALRRSGSDGFFRLQASRVRQEFLPASVACPQKEVGASKRRGLLAFAGRSRSMSARCWSVRAGFDVAWAFRSACCCVLVRIASPWFVSCRWAGVLPFPFLGLVFTLSLSSGWCSALLLLGFVPYCMMLAFAALPR